MFEAGAPVGMGALVHQAREALAAAAGLDVASMEHREMCAAVVGLERARRVLDAAEGHLLAELDDRRAPLRAAGLATSKWLAREARLPVGVAKDRLSIAKRLRRFLPEVDAALSRGRVGFDHARVFARVVNGRNAEALSILVPMLLEKAADTAFERWRQQVLDLAAYLDPDGTHDPDDDLLRNRLTISRTNGFSLLHGELVGDLAVIFEEAVEAKADELFRRYSRDRERFPDQHIPPRATLRALALVELIELALAVDVDSSKRPATEASIVIHTDTHPDDPASPTAPEGQGPVVTTPDGRRLAPNTAALLLCAGIHGALLTCVTRNGVPAAETDTYRPSRQQRRMLEHRDGGCTFPGCTARIAWCDAHHLIPWPTGPTALENLTLLCRHHHRLAHRGWKVELTEDGWTEWTSPQGHRRSGQRHGATRAGPEPESGLPLSQAIQIRTVGSDDRQHMR